MAHLTKLEIKAISTTRIAGTVNTLTSNVIEPISGFAMVFCSRKSLNLRFRIRVAGPDYMAKVCTLCDLPQSI
jgi:UDP-N-acetyl-D-mannosaminuronic acid transferase (WecB/TagA/CpsF family)